MSGIIRSKGLNAKGDGTGGSVDGEIGRADDGGGGIRVDAMTDEGNHKNIVASDSSTTTGHRSSGGGGSAGADSRSARSGGVSSSVECLAGGKGVASLGSQRIEVGRCDEAKGDGLSGSSVVSEIGGASDGGLYTRADAITDEGNLKY